MNWKFLLQNETLFQNDQWAFYCKNSTKVIESWLSMSPEILYESDNFLLIPWHLIPIERSNLYTIAALSPRIELNYFLLADEPLKNITSYDKRTTLFCTDLHAIQIIKHFNPSIVVLDNNKDSDLEIKLLPTNRELWVKDISKKFAQSLSTQEFIPPVASGILAAVTFSDDLDTRKFLAKQHTEDSKLAGNIERELKKRLGKQLIAAHVSKDKAYNYHANMVLQKNEELNFHAYSQSTILDYSNNFIEKI